MIPAVHLEGTLRRRCFSHSTTHLLESPARQRPDFAGRPSFSVAEKYAARNKSTKTLVSLDNKQVCLQQPRLAVLQHSARHAKQSRWSSSRRTCEAWEATTSPSPTSTAPVSVSADRSLDPSTSTNTSTASESERYCPARRRPPRSLKHRLPSPTGALAALVSAVAAAASSAT